MSRAELGRHDPVVLLVEDDEPTARRIELQLQTAGFEVVSIDDGSEVMRAWENHLPDIAVIERVLPGSTGADVVRELRARTNIPILLLAGTAEVAMVEGLRVEGVLERPFSAVDVAERVRGLLDQERHLDPEGATVVAAGGVKVDRGRQEATVDGRVLKLPRKQLELLALLVEHAGCVLTRKELLTTVWGTQIVGDRKTLDVHVRRLRQQIEVDPRNPERLVTIRGTGYRYEP